MTDLFARLSSLTARITLVLMVFVASGIAIIAWVGYSQVADVTEKNAMVRIDRAARSGAAITALRLQDKVHVVLSDAGVPTAIRLLQSTKIELLKPIEEYNSLVKEIGEVNQGAANVFGINEAGNGFDRVATTFRRPDGSTPPSTTMTKDHPAFANLLELRPFVGHVPVMGRMRLAYMTPIIAMNGAISGVLSVDVGWVDDLVAARDQLRNTIILWSISIMLGVASLGALLLYRELLPLRSMSTFAHALASGKSSGDVPYLERKDELGKLAAGLSRVVELQDTLEVVAYTDSLTGAGTRTRFLTDLAEAVAQCRTGRKAFALLMLDVDHFRETNDAFGHAAGDALLVRVKNLVEAELKAGDKFSRIGGDKFMVLSDISTDANGASVLGDRLVKALAKPILMPEAEVQVGLSIGIVLLPFDTNIDHEAHSFAELALQKAKNDGRGRFAFYSAELNADSQRRLTLGRMLRSAIENNELAVHFQPQISPVDNSLFGVEALARWPHPTDGLVPPNVFIKIAEDLGLINDLGQWVLNESCRTARQWLDSGFNFQHVSVNVSPAQLLQPHFTDTVAATLAKHQLPPSFVCLEITESLFVNHAEHKIMVVLNGLRDLGLLISLDDFGCGYSSLGYLNKLPLDQLKLDRDFISNVDLDARKQSLLRGMVALGHGLGLKIVAEGAERAEEVEFLNELGCEAIQGYFFCRPVPALLVQGEVDRVKGMKQKNLKVVRQTATVQSSSRHAHV
jgi:diguanylate cyclase